MAVLFNSLHFFHPNKVKKSFPFGFSQSALVAVGVEANTFETFELVCVERVTTAYFVSPGKPSS
jgi:hypothetical protein